MQDMNVGRRMILTVGRVDRIRKRPLETLRGSLLDSLGDEGLASGVRDVLVLGRVGVVDLFRIAIEVSATERARAGLKYIPSLATTSRHRREPSSAR